MKKFISIILVIATLFGLTSISVCAEDTAEATVTVIVNDTEFVFDADTTEEFRNRFIEHYFAPEDDGAATYGLMCTLFGHKLESSVVTTITHKAKATAPRCLRQRFNMEACSRCDYSTKTLISSEYISCC